MAVREMIRIDEDKCTGCGECVPSCVEGALQIIDGKARLITDSYCDGLGACLGDCPEDALTIVKREAVDFDEEAALSNVAKMKAEDEKKAAPAESPPAFSGCPGSKAQSIERDDSDSKVGDVPSELSHWPIQLSLLNPSAPFLAGKELVLAADCTSFAFGAFHDKFLKGKSLAITCPKLGDPNADTAKLAAIFENATPSSITVAVMEVPCCQGLLMMTKRALEMAEKDIPVRAVTLSVTGEIMTEVSV